MLIFVRWWFFLGFRLGGCFVGVIHNRGDEGDRSLLVLVEDFGVYLRSGDEAMPEEFAHGVYVSSEVEHHNSERVAAAVECYMLVDACFQRPNMQTMVSCVGGQDTLALPSFSA